MHITTYQKQLAINEELIKICREIEAENKTDDEWSEIESCDQFQSESYCGGYDGIEQEFTFSYFDKLGKEWWFQFSLPQVSEMLGGTLQYLDLNEPNR